MRSKQTQTHYILPLISLRQRYLSVFLKLKGLPIQVCLLSCLLAWGTVLTAQNPLSGNQGFQILSEGNFTFTGYTHVHGALGIGGNLTLNCNGVLAEICMDGVSSYVFPGDGTTATGLLVKGAITWTNGGAKVMGGKYMHIGNSTGCIQSDNGVNNATQVLPTGGSYNQARRIEGALDQTPNPSPFQTVGFDFISLFNTYRTRSQGLAACTNNVQLYNASNVAIAGNNVSTSQNVQINSLANGVNVLNLTPTALNNITELKFNAGALPSASKLLVINVPLSANYVWNNRNMPGLSGALHGAYVFWNFSGNTTYNLTINTAALVIGTIFAPNHNLIKTGTGDIEGGMFAKSMTLGLGEIHLYNFSGNVPICGVTENCVNGIDDDGDGLVDYNDPDCCSTSSMLPQGAWSLKYFDSQETVGENGYALNAFDGNPNTFWHSQWYNSTAPLPHEIQLDLGTTRSLNGFRYLPRQDGGVNGRIANYEFYVSMDGTTWGSPVATGTWTYSNANEKVVSFSPKTGRYIRLRALSEALGSAWTTVAELKVDVCGSIENCANGIDDDGDGLVDANDPDCSCSAPTFIFQNPSLLSGTAGSVGAVYRFNSVLPGVHANVTIVAKSHADIGITSLDEPAATNGGYDYAFQPIIDYDFWNSNGTYDAGGDRYVRFKFDFIDASTGNPRLLPEIKMTAVDVDGDDYDVREFVQTSQFNSYELESPTTLTLSGALKALGGINAFNGVVETALQTMITYEFNNKSSITIDYGANYDGSPFGTGLADERLNCLYFKCYSLPIQVLCPTVQAGRTQPINCANPYVINSSISGQSGTCSIQWQSSSDNVNWVNIPGATSDNYTAPTLAATTYFRVYYNCTGNSTCGNVYSNVVTVNVQAICVEICNNSLDDDNDGLTDGADSDCMTFCPTGSLTLERWTGISGTTIANLTSNAAYPNSPSFIGTITSFDGPDNVADNFGTRVRGYLQPSVTGAYSFNLTGDDDCALYLSTNAQPASKVLISSFAGYTGTAEYTKYASQTSANINLIAGQKYYIELLHKEGTGGDHFQVYWKTPSNSTWTIVPGANLRPINCTEICNNSFDDDGDGLVDCADSNCPLPTAAVSGTNTICAGATTTLTATGGGTYLWSTGATTAAINVTPASNTTYTVTVTSANGCTATANRIVTVSANPTASVTGTNTVCPGVFTTLTASGGTSYLWSTTATTAGINVAPATTTTYTVTVTNAGGCTAVASRTVTVNAATVANAGADATICSGTSTTLTASGSGSTAPYTYAWSNSLGNAATATANPLVTTTYTVTVTSATGCTGTDQVVVNVNASPVSSAGSNVTVCSGTVVNLSGSASGGVSPFTYTWNNGLGTGATKTVTPTATTIYSVTVTGSNACSSVAQISVNVNVLPVANAGADATICQSQTTTLSATASGAPAPFNYAWSNGYNGVSQSVTPASTTTFTVTVTSSNGCTATDQKLVTVQSCAEICNNGIDDDADGLADCADTDCGPSANAGTNLSICPGNTALLSVGVTGGSSPYTYAWNNGLGSGASKIVSPAVTTTYSVTVTSASGCTSTDQVVVTVQACSENCTNGIDDDGDGLVDCDDPDCAGVTAPVLVPDNYTTCPGMTYSNRVTYNDNNLNNPEFSIATDPTHGTVTIDWTGKFIYIPNGFDCVTDQFVYQVCNQSTGCCSMANVTIVLGDNTAPQLINVPADLTINCDDMVPVAPTVTGFDQCPGIFMDFDETSNQNYVGACGSYTITRTWTATDFCGNSVSADQKLTVVDLTKPELFKVHTTPDGSVMVAGVAQRVTHDWKYVRFPVTFKSMPVVLSTVSTNSDASPIVVQMRNVSQQGFDIRLREEEAADGAHGNENVSWVAVEAGLSGTGMKWEAGTLANVDHLGDTVVFRQGYGSAPIFLPALITNAQSDPATLRLSALDNQSVQLFAQEETSGDAEVIRMNETIAYMAIENGQGLMDNEGSQFGEAGKLSLSQAWATVNLANSYTKPVVIVSGISNVEGQPLTIRVRNVTSKKFEVRLQEWGYLDGSHTPESVSWMVVEGSVPANQNFYCEGKANRLIPNVNIMALDNCDDLVEFAFDQSSAVEGAGLLNNYTWTAIDDCGNTALLARMDTCIVAAVRVKASLFGAFANNNGTNLMRDNLREQTVVPIVEPYSNMPTSYPHVVSSHPTVVICHHPGQADQVQMEVEATELQNYLADGDEVGSCGLPPAELPVGAANATYKTKKDGEWSNPDTWVNGLIPSPMNNLNNLTITISHNVSSSTGDLMLKNNSKLYVINGQLTVSNGQVRMQNGELCARNAVIDIKNDFYAWSGDCRIDIKDSQLKVGGSFSNESGTRRLENVCVEVGVDYNCGYNVSIDSLIGTIITVDGKVRVFNSAKMNLDNAKFRLINGNFNVELGCYVKGQHVMLLLENGIVLSLGYWTAQVDQYCVAGTSVLPLLNLPATEDCANLTDWFLSCDPDNIVLDNNDEGDTGNSGNSSNTSTGPAAANDGVIQPTILQQTGISAVVDWLLLELRDKDNPALIKGYATVVLRRDGSITSESGDSVIVFKQLLQGDYLVSIRHRNHLGLMTENPIFLSIVNTPLVDFTDIALPMKGGATAGRVFNGKRFLWGGDLNGDGKIVYQGPGNDVFRLFSRIITEENNVDNLANYIVTGYEHTDLNMDGKVIYQGPLNDRSPLLYNSILVHTSNGSLLANFIVSDFIP